VTFARKARYSSSIDDHNSAQVSCSPLICSSLQGG